jgi:hypothetical protein
MARKIQPLGLAAFLLGLVSPASPAGEGALLREHPFALDQRSEVVALLRGAAPGCGWGRASAEAAVLRLLVDGKYSQHVILFRGDAEAEYRVALGTLAPGPHRLAVAVDTTWTPRACVAPLLANVETEAAGPGTPRDRLLAHAPILHVRPNAYLRFTDVPLVMWAEEEATPGGRRLRYSAVFSNEDGGTPSDRLLATWGRLTDIEYVYGVLLDGEDRILAEEHQAEGHALRPFAGVHEGRHPLLYVTTDNNMVSDRGAARARFAPEPVAFDLVGVSREAVMDANPWTYRVSAEEARREARVDPQAAPGGGRIPDPRRFATLEACAETKDTTLTFALGVESADGGVRFFESDGGQPAFRIARAPDNFPNGCFRGAVALPEGTRPAAVRTLRVRAYTRAPREGETPLPKGAGSARLRRVNSLFLLGPDDQPGPSLFRWTGDVPLAPEGPPAELEIGG